MARIRNAVVRWILIEPETIEHYRATMPGLRDWLALLDGEPVGVGGCTRITGMDESDAAFAVNCVLPEARGQGVGTAIYRAVSAHARSLGKSELEVLGFEDDPGGVRFAERHGFVVVNRARALRLLLDGCPRPSIDLPEKIEITNLAERPELARGVWETLCGWTGLPESPSMRCSPSAAPGGGEGSPARSRQPRSSGRSTTVSASYAPGTRNATWPREPSMRTSPTRRFPTASSIAARSHQTVVTDERIGFALKPTVPTRSIGTGIDHEGIGRAAECVSNRI